MPTAPDLSPAPVPRGPVQDNPTAPRGVIRTFHPRRSPLGPARVDALARLWPTLGFSVHDADDGPPLTTDGTLDTVRLFGRSAPLVLEIGSGMGEAVVAMAADDPDRDYLAIEAHVPGIANLLLRLEGLGVPNVRVAHGDALALLRDRIAPDSLDAVNAFFPDPWPKARHHKRRLIQPAHVALIRSRLTIGGTLHCATDWAPYAAAILAAVDADPGLVNPYGGAAPRPPHRPVTRFEQRGLDLGHRVVDVIATRVGVTSSR